MKTDEILLDIRSNGGFNNLHHWSKKEIATWVMYAYPCSRYVANKVAEHLV